MNMIVEEDRKNYFKKIFIFVEKSWAVFGKEV